MSWGRKRADEVGRGEVGDLGGQEVVQGEGGDFDGVMASVWTHTLIVVHDTSLSACGEKMPKAFAPQFAQRLQSLIVGNDPWLQSLPTIAGRHPLSVCCGRLVRKHCQRSLVPNLPASLAMIASDGHER